MSRPSERMVRLPAGDFRVLEWPGEDPAVVFLHGLSGIADVWGPTVAAMRSHRRFVALDQRGHGQSPQPPSGYAVADYDRDAAALIRELGAGPVHLAGHSMGARVALVLAANQPELLRSVAIVDIGPEAWKANITGSIHAFDRLPTRLASRQEAVAFMGVRPPTTPERRPFVPESSNRAAQSEEIFFARLREGDGGSYEWRASIDALKQSVRLQRSRSYWSEWRAISLPAILIRGAVSTELRPAIADRMRRENPAVQYIEYEGIGHNIPLLAPGRLAATLEDFWQTADTDSP